MQSFLDPRSKRAFVFVELALFGTETNRLRRLKSTCAHDCCLDNASYKATGLQNPVTDTNQDHRICSKALKLT